MSASEEQGQGPIIRDRRRIDPVTGRPRDPDHGGSAQAGAAGQAGADQRGTGQPRPGRHAVSKPGGPRTAGSGAAGSGPSAGPGQPGGQQSDAAAADLAAKLAERTADLQRVQAEYANYRKRVDRDRAAVREFALAGVLTELLPVLDDIGRAREHGELTGGFKSVAESFESAVTKLGLTAFGEPGETFDPKVHEALMHSYSPDVTEPTCIQILQPGYRVGERTLRPARVAVAEPADPTGARPAVDEADTAEPVLAGGEAEADVEDAEPDQAEAGDQDELVTDDKPAGADGPGRDDAG